MGRSALITIAALIAAACIGIDAWFATARCSVSPPAYLTGIAIGAVSQLFAVAMPLVVAKHFPEESIRFHLRGVGLGLLLGFASIFVLQESLLFSDVIGKARIEHSIGMACFGPASRSAHGT
jgi:hypothetical protein